MSVPYLNVFWLNSCSPQPLSFDVNDLTDKIKRNGGAPTAPPSAHIPRLGFSSLLSSPNHIWPEHTHSDKTWLTYLCTSKYQWAIQEHSKYQWAIHEHSKYQLGVSKYQWAIQEHSKYQWAIHEHSKYQLGVSKYQPKFHNTNNKKRCPENVQNTNRPYQNTNRPYQNTNRPYQNTNGPYQNTNLVGIMIIGILTVGILIPTRQDPRRSTTVFAQHRHLPCLLFHSGSKVPGERLWKVYPWDHPPLPRDSLPSGGHHSMLA